MIGIGLQASESHSPLKALDDPLVLSAMKRAWMQSGAGTTGVEATFRLDGSPSDYQIVAARRTNQIRNQNVPIIPGTTFAVFHIHPLGTEPDPSPNDVRVADKYGFRIYTMHHRGLYEYDPVTRKTTKLLHGLRWLKRR